MTMGNSMFVIIMVLAGVILGATIGVVVTLLWYNCRSKRFRSQQDIPDIIGKWRCQWFDDSVDSNEPKIEDTVEIRKWTTNGQFIGHGIQPEFHLSYPLIGEVDASRLVTLIYKAARYPYEPNRGIACLQISRDGETMEGRWYGRRFSGKLGGGIVKCFRKGGKR